MDARGAPVTILARRSRKRAKLIAERLTLQLGTDVMTKHNLEWMRQQYAAEFNLPLEMVPQSLVYDPTTITIDERWDRIDFYTWILVRHGPTLRSADSWRLAIAAQQDLIRLQTNQLDLKRQAQIWARRRNPGPDDAP